MRDHTMDIQSKLQLLRRTYATQLPAKVAELNQQLDGWRGGEPGAADRLRRLAHNLTGSGASFGFGAISEYARPLENELRRLAAVSSELGEGHASEVVAHARALETVIQSAIVDADRERSADASPAVGVARAVAPLVVAGQASLVDREPVPGGRLVLVEPDPRIAAELSFQLAPFGYRAQVASTVTEAALACAADRPLALVVGLPADVSLAPALEQLSRSVHTPGLPVPVLVVSNRSDLAARLEAVRGGASAFLTRPVDVIRLVGLLDRLTPQPDEAPYRVLIVDDHDLLSRAYAQILLEAGFEAAICPGATDVLRSLADNRPDVILMDMYMPDCSGPELAQLIRQDESFVDVPILFLSVELNLGRRLDAIGIGGDEFLTRPIEPTHLIAAVTARARRARQVRELTMHDPLTGLGNHTRIRQTLESELARASRLRTRVAFALIDLDHFKRVNDAHGHPAGDRVLRGLARLMLQRIRRTDVAGRVGGDRLALVLPNASLSAAARLVDDVRGCFEHLRHHGAMDEFQVTMSAGVAEFPTCRDVDELMDGADRALRRAKERGRNRVEVHLTLAAAQTAAAGDVGAAA